MSSSLANVAPCPYMSEQHRFLRDFANAQVCLNLCCWHRLQWLFPGAAKKWTYSWLSLSRPRLSRITAYLEVKIWSLPKDENLTTGKQILWKRGEIAPKEQFLLFSTNFFIISRISRVRLHNTFVKCGCSIYFFLNSAILVCRGTDISKNFQRVPWNSR